VPDAHPLHDRKLERHELAGLKNHRHDEIVAIRDMIERERPARRRNGLPDIARSTVSCGAAPVGRHPRRVGRVPCNRRERPPLNLQTGDRPLALTATQQETRFDHLKRVVLDTLKVLLDPDTSPRCAATAFFGFLSFFPAIATVALIYGILANGAGTTVRMDNVRVTGNTNGIAMANGGKIFSFGNSNINGNTTSDGAPLPPTLVKQ